MKEQDIPNEDFRKKSDWTENALFYWSISGRCALKKQWMTAFMA